MKMVKKVMKWIEFLNSPINSDDGGVGVKTIESITLDCARSDQS